MHLVSIHVTIVTAILWASLGFATAYDIDETSCRGNEMIDYVQKAVKDARAMIAAGQDAGSKRKDGDSRLKLWRTTLNEDLEQVADNLAKVKERTDMFVYGPGSFPIIFCDAHDLGTDDGDVWKVPESRLTLQLVEGQTDKTANSHTPMATAFLSYRSAPNSTSIVVLMGASPLTLNNVATLPSLIASPPNNEAIDDPGRPPNRRKPGSLNGNSLDKHIRRYLTSFTILREYMHLAQPVKLTRGKDEVFGWSRCTGTTSGTATTIRSFDEAILNADSYAYWCLSEYIEQTTPYRVINGVLLDLGLDDTELGTKPPPFTLPGLVGQPELFKPILPKLRAGFIGRRSVSLKATKKIPIKSHGRN